MIAAIRFHSSGEIPNYNYLERLIKFAAGHPAIRIYTYTKRYSFLEKYVASHGDSIEKAIPGNLVINVSIWHNNYNNPYNFPTFEYDDGSDPELASVAHCPAVDKDGNKTGITCANCKHCIYAMPGQRKAVYAH